MATNQVEVRQVALCSLSAGGGNEPALALSLGDRSWNPECVIVPLSFSPALIPKLKNTRDTFEPAADCRLIQLPHRSEHLNGIVGLNRGVRWQIIIFGPDGRFTIKRQAH
jgi:hypothetical protein